MRAAGGRVAQLIKTPVLMSQPVTPGRERGREREDGREGGVERELPGWSWAAPNKPSRQQTSHPANPPGHMSDKP